jgi:hypothetical protein
MAKQKIIDYVMETPNNPNEAVLRTLLSEVEGGTNLPEVTNEDNGSVLTVVDGEWNKAEPSSGNASVVTFTISYAPSGSPNYICDKTYDELMAAITAKKILLGCFYTDSSYYTFTHINASSDGYIVCWEGLQYEYMGSPSEYSWSNMCSYFFISSDNTISRGPSLYINGDLSH